MFGTILGRLPRPPLAATDDEAVRDVLGLQELAGLEPLSDGSLRFPDPAAFAADIAARAGPVTPEAWRFAASCTGREVKQVLPGPLTLALASLGVDVADLGEATDWPAETGSRSLAIADALRTEVTALRDAGCRLVEIDEAATTAIGGDEERRRHFRAAHDRLTRELDGVHLSLAIGGGNADGAGPETIFGAGYASFAFDLIAGPDNWRLVTALPGDRGVICGALSPLEGSDDGPELLVWAAHYAASTGRRGLDRVGLANAPGLHRLPLDVVERKLGRLADGARLAARESVPELAQALDPRAINTRSAAAGRFVPRPARRRRPGEGT